MRINVKKENLYLGLIFFSTIFFIKSILIKPVYIVLFLLILWGYGFNKYKINMAYILVSYLFISFLIFHLIYMKSDPGMVLNAILSILSFPILFFLMSKANKENISIFLNMSILYFSFEMLWRVTHPIYTLVDYTGSDEGWYYPFKYNSFVFTDSNFVALHIICLFFIALLYRLKFQSFILLLLMLLTFSRSGILGVILVLLYFSVDGSKYRKLIKPVFYMSSIILFVYLVINISMLTDGSFLSKFYIYNSAIDYAYKYFTLENYFFGIGLSKSYESISIGAHSIWLILLFETGILGLIIYILYFIPFYFGFFVKSSQSREKLTFFFIVFLLMGFSLGLYLFPIMVLTIASILNLRDENYA
ncbi:O-antigen ligase family protein [Acinetobacter bereziniae]|uniref:O-antigen ligase family protein n=1 Tax=Acinetobacter bereziniae TaxID=106648 RepID=UPI003215434D